MASSIVEDEDRSLVNKSMRHQNSQVSDLEDLLQEICSRNFHGSVTYWCVTIFSLSFLWDSGAIHLQSRQEIMKVVSVCVCVVLPAQRS